MHGSHIAVHVPRLNDPAGVAFQDQCGQVAGAKGARVYANPVIGMFDLLEDRMPVCLLYTSPSPRD